MNTLSELKSLERIHSFIKTKRNGKPKELADRLGISRSCLYRNIQKLEELGAEITYSRMAGHFYYENDFEFKITIETNSFCEIYGN